MTNSAAVDDEQNPLPDVKRWLISCDESGTHGARFYGFGTLWMPWQRRGEFQQVIQSLQGRHGYYHEFKWHKVKRRYVDFYLDLVEEFFRTSWLSFHCFIAEKAMVDLALHDIELARRKHFTMLLTNKIKRCLKAHPERKQTFRVWVDPIASPYPKADEVVEIVGNHVLRKVFGEVRPVDKVITRTSHETPSIELCDVLLGATIDAWQEGATADAKRAVAKSIANHLGWETLRSDTKPSERKFNIWMFHDKKLGPRRVETRDVELLYPVPVPRRRQ